MRKRGARSALLAHRLAAAAALGARHAAAETGVPQPGQAAPNHMRFAYFSISGQSHAG
jgi:hypothetical protein